MRKLLLVISICCCFTAKGQEKQYEYTDTSLVVPEDQVENSETGEDVISDILSDTTLYVESMPVSADSILSIKRDKRFAYMKDIEATLRKMKQEAMNNKKNDQNSSPSFLEILFRSGFIQIFFWSAAIIFVCFILYNLFLSKGIFRRTTTAAGAEEITEEEKEIAVSDYDQLINQARGKADYRLAIRYQFLKGIAMLAEKDYLHIAAGKTNYQYMQEIKPDLRNEFASLVLAYEYTWYGNFSPEKEMYQSLEDKFSNFYRQIL